MPSARALPARTRHFAILDGLRGIAAIAVVIAHASSMIMGHALLERKYMAVQFFFMLSGFVVMCAYEHRLRTDMTLMQFCLRRAIRLYPLIWIGTGMASLYYSVFDAGFAADPKRLAYIGLSAAALPAPAPNFNIGKFPVNPPEWSLFFELGAYLAFGLFVRRASTKALCTLAAIGLALYAITALGWHFSELPFRYYTFGIWASFTIGMLLWRAHEARVLARFSLPFPVLALAMLVSCALPEHAPLVINPLLVALLFPAMILFGANTHGTASSRFHALLGELSYPLYILHWPIVLCTQHFLLGVLGPGATTIAACIFSMIVSWAIYIVIDKPVRAWLSLKLCASSIRSGVRNNW